EEAMASYEKTRNDAVTPIFDFTCQLAKLEPPPPEMSRLFLALRGNQADTDRFVGAFNGTVPIPEFFSQGNVARIVAAAGCPAAGGRSGRRRPGGSVLLHITARASGGHEGERAQAAIADLFAGVDRADRFSQSSRTEPAVPQRSRRTWKG